MYVLVIIEIEFQEQLDFQGYTIFDLQDNSIPVVSRLVRTIDENDINGTLYTFHIYTACSSEYAHGKYMNYQWIENIKNLNSEIERLKFGWVDWKEFIFSITNWF